VNNLYNAVTTKQGAAEWRIYLSKLKARRLRLEAELERIKAIEAQVANGSLPGP
jgi:hypothetical protein